MQNPQLVTFVYQNILPGTNVRPDFRTKTAKVLGIAQIIFGILLIALHIGYIIHKTVQRYVSWTGVIVSYLSSCCNSAPKNSPYFTFQKKWHYLPSLAETSAINEFFIQWYKLIDKKLYRQFQVIIAGSFGVSASKYKTTCLVSWCSLK